MPENQGERLQGAFWFLYSFDVCEEIRLADIAAEASARRQADPKRPTPEYVRFERAPVVIQLEPLVLPTGDRVRGELRFYDYGAISVKLELPFDLGWQELVARSSRLLDDPAPREYALKTVRDRMARIAPALVNAREQWLEEEYYVVQVTPAGRTAQGLIAARGPDIARIVRGEARELSETEHDETLRARMSYSPNHLLVIGWAAAFIHDTAEGATEDLQLLEYANTQLLEFRYYDQVLTGVLQNVYGSLARKQGLAARWRMGSEARKLNTILLDVRELTERADTAIKFLSDMFSARVYRLAAEKIGVDDYRRLVDGKLATASELYRFMMDQFHETRGFVLESMIVIILIIDLYFLFAGRT